MQKGMTKVSVMYPNEEGKRFDIDYYVNKHLPLVAGLIGDDLKQAEVIKGVAKLGEDPTIPEQPEYVAIGNMYFDSVEAFQQAFGAIAERLMGDVPNYTDITPIIQISEVVT